MATIWRIMSRFANIKVSEGPLHSKHFKLIRGDGSRHWAADIINEMLARQCHDGVIVKPAIIIASPACARFTISR